MLIDPVLFMNPEELDDRFLVATYYCATKPSQNIMKFAAALAVEQTTGTWVPVPEETPEVRKNFIGRIVGIYETPAHQMEIPEDVTERHFTIQIAYPWRNFGPMFSMMLTTVIGNISSSGKVKLVDINFPKEYLADFKGPKFGIQGIRDYLGVYNRPLVNNMIKPCTGIDPKTTAKLAYEAAVGGTDIIKDDELVADAKHCPLVDRVKAVMAALKRADDEKGEKTIFVFNVPTGDGRNPSPLGEEKFIICRYATLPTGCTDQNGPQGTPDLASQISEASVDGSRSDPDP